MGFFLVQFTCRGRCMSNFQNIHKQEGTQTKLREDSDRYTNHKKKHNYIQKPWFLLYITGDTIITQVLVIYNKDNGDTPKFPMSPYCM